MFAPIFETSPNCTQLILIYINGAGGQPQERPAAKLRVAPRLWDKKSR
jgi:hypothetical protein